MTNFFKQQLHYQHIDTKFIFIRIFYMRIIKKLIQNMNELNENIKFKKKVISE